MSYRLRIDRLESFLSVADTGNFRQAAARLHISQPPLTRRIQALEAELGVALFERTTRRVTLTDAGRRLANRLRPCFAEIEAACEEARQASDNPTGRLTIGMTSALDPSAFPTRQQLERRLLEHQLLEHQPIEHPSVENPSAEHPRQAEIQLIRASSRELMSRLLDRQGETCPKLAFIGMPSEVPDAIETTRIGHEPLWVALPSGHPQAALEVIDLRVLNSTTLLWFPRRDNPVYFDHCERVFREGGYHPPRSEEPEDHHHLLAAVAAGEGVALMPASYLGTSRDGVDVRPLSERWQALGTDICLAWRRDDHEAYRLARRLVARSS
ncbi:LysR family transcriptional regulator [Halomonas huangheensis]|uniref:HTH lysR-type domain-containing protein n=1 Tax=Halomonas huangheensis TaxID=1178482 RepID=W1NCR3_9GAMM|nr:LysR family transcriptional regulator [Halomonas huangheensis]ALM50944.1 hypothetical protein AR456_00515 [Halomonas huangheensis]ERL53342.1 hypothetical protein BJB45_21130 [Halomonas huangheensis]